MPGKVSDTVFCFFGQSWVKRALAIFIPSTLLILLLLHYFYTAEKTIMKDRIREGVEAHLATVHEAIDEDLERVYQDLMFLLDTSSLRKYLTTGTARDKNVLEQELAHFSRTRKIYDQIRLLHKDGMEKIRVNREGDVYFAIPESDLQNKSHRYYFKKAIRYGNREVYVSPLDLNIEHGKIEEPHKPLMRIASPIYTSDGEKTGIIILNVLADGIIHSAESGNHHETASIHILNSDGYWLYSANQGNNWGFMLDHPERTFQNRFRNAWKVINRDSFGAEEMDSGLFVFRKVKIVPEEFNPMNASLLEPNQYLWAVASTSPAVFADRIHHLRRGFISIASLLIIVIAMGSTGYSFILHTKDLEDRRKLKEESEHAWRQTFSAVSDKVALIDTNFRITRINRSLQELHPNFTKGMDCNDFFKDFLNIDCCRELLKSSGKSDTPVHREISDKNKRWYHSETIAVASPNDKAIINYYVLALHDISDLKHAQESLQEKQNLLERAQRIANTGSWHCTLPDRNVYWTSEFYNLLGRTPGTVSPSMALYFEQISEDQRNDVVELVQKAIDNGEAGESFHSIIRTDGASRTVKEYIEISFDRNCKPNRIDGIVRDITEEHELEEKLRHSEKLQAIGQLAGGIAHDFNNQLGGIIGFAEMIANKNGKDPSIKRYTERILSAAQRSADLTSKLLAFSRKTPGIRKSLNLHELIRETLSILERSLAKNINLEVRTDASNSVTFGDSSQLQSALLNLCLNAKDAMPDGGQLSVITENTTLDESYCRKLTESVEPGPFIRISISDTGIGIPKSLTKLIFEPFFTTKPIGKGTGMGLSAVYGTARAHEGFIQVYSEPENKTTFYLYLPVNTNTETTPPKRELPEAQSSERIMIIDDEEIIRLLTEEMLCIFGYSIEAFADPRHAIKSYRKHSDTIDLILLDMIMPTLSGKETFEAIRTINPKAKIIIMSGFSLNNEASAVLEAGAETFLPKPFTQQELLTAVSESLHAETIV